MGRRVPPIWADMLCAYLDAEPRAVWVLSDLLTEAGAEPLRPGSDDKRVRRVVGVLPPRYAHEVVCDFAEHVLGDPLPVDIHWALLAKRRWLAGEIDDEGLRAAGRQRRERTALMDGVMSTSPTPSVAQAVAKYALALTRIGVPAEVRWQRDHLAAALSLWSSRSWALQR